jgi:hemin uptake protein HemP
MSTKIGFIARLWFYFRMGYSTYLTFLLGYVSTLITVYYLAIKNIPSLLDVFPRFVPFAILATVIGVPLSVGIGWLHLKRTPAYSSEMDIGVEANPYYYKLPPGYNREVYAPLYIELLGQVMRLLESQKLLRPEDKVRIEEIQGKLQLLKNGGLVGSPRTRM